MGNKLECNFHSHTKRCGHANGEDEDYVLTAIKMGFQEYGFSDHVFLPQASQPGMRGEYYLLPSYVQSIRNLAAKYRDQIKLYLGFEAEYYKRYESYYRDLLKSKTVDYLIIGQHCFIDQDCFYWYADEPNGVEGINHYTDDLIEGMATGLFSCVVHPDIFLSWRRVWDKESLKCAKRIAEASIKFDVPLEVNMGRLMNRSIAVDSVDIFTLPYPYGPFWDVVSSCGCKVVIGVDDHSPFALEHNDYEFALTFAKNHKLNLLRRFDFKKVK